eukprot:gene9224-12437_t
MALKKQVLKKEREKNWRIPPSEGIPKYSSETDPYCPTGQIRKFNNDKKAKAKSLAEFDKNTEKWMKNTLEPSIIDTPLKINLGLKVKALNILSTDPYLKNSVNNYSNMGSSITEKSNYMEIEIIQKVIIRENLLSELYKILKSQNDIVPILGEVNELVKALRFQTVDIVEDISTWQQQQSSSSVIRPFLYRGINYLVKIKSDLDFMDYYDEVVEKFCFEFTSNPLAYRGGGNILAGYDVSSTTTTEKSNNKKGNFSQFSSISNNNSFNSYIDGIEITRLHYVEKVIKNEINRLKNENIHNYDYSTANINNNSYDMKDPSYKPDHFTTKNSSSIESINNYAFKEDLNANEINQKNKNEQYNNEKKSPAKSSFNPKRVKLERIETLREEANELKAMIKLTDLKVQEAISFGKEAAAQHMTAEITVINTKLKALNQQVKDLQRESYFIELEMKRKLGVAKTLKDELQEEKKRNAIKKKITAKIKKEGLLAAIQSFGGTNPIIQNKPNKIISKNQILLSPSNENENEKQVISNINSGDDTQNMTKYDNNITNKSDDIEYNNYNRQSRVFTHLSANDDNMKERYAHMIAQRRIDDDEDGGDQDDDEEEEEEEEEEENSLHDVDHGDMSQGDYDNFSYNNMQNDKNVVNHTNKDKKDGNNLLAEMHNFSNIDEEEENKIFETALNNNNNDNIEDNNNDANDSLSPHDHDQSNSSNKYELPFRENNKNNNDKLRNNEALDDDNNDDSSAKNNIITNSDKFQINNIIENNHDDNHYYISDEEDNNNNMNKNYNLINKNYDINDDATPLETSHDLSTSFEELAFPMDRIPNSTIDNNTNNNNNYNDDEKDILYYTETNDYSQQKNQVNGNDIEKTYPDYQQSLEVAVDPPVGSGLSAAKAMKSSVKRKD